MFPLPPLALLTGEIGSGLWPTPTLDSASNRAGRYAQGGMPLTAAVKLWPTPTVHGNTNKPVDGTKAGWGLRSAVMMWPTPCEQNHRIGMQNRYGPGQRRSMLNDAVAAVTWRTPNTVDAKGGSRSDPSSGQTQLCHQVGGALNPTWVEWLMGFPEGWTDCGPLATRSSRKSRS